MTTGDTLHTPRGSSVYQEIHHPTSGEAIDLTYNDLWLIIVCRTSMDGDWQRTRASAAMVPDSARKIALIDRLWQLERSLGGLPPIPDEIRQLHVRRAHNWFNRRVVSASPESDTTSSSAR
jgi:hypothetical protein